MNLERVVAGSLSERSVPELLKKIQDEQITGSLTLRRHGTEKTVFVQEGRVIFARSTNPDDRLGEYLVCRGVITVEQYLRSVELLSEGKRQGTALIEQAAISPEDLVRHVTGQVQEILYSLFPWTRGDYELRVQSLPLGDMIVLNIPIEEVILVGMRRLTQFTLVWQGLGASLNILYAPTGKAEAILYRVSLTEDESAVYSQVNGKFDLAQIMSMSYVSNFEALRTLWALKIMGVIEPVDALEVAREGPSEDYELEELIEAYNRFFIYTYDFIAERLGELVDHITDRAVAQAGARFQKVLRDVKMHNHGRVEYEQIYANTAELDPQRRLNDVEQTLNELLFALIKLTRKELGAEDEQYLVEQLRLLGETVPGVPIDQLTDRS
jgi:hypothetical protein